jgi:antitoxin PrlF
MHYHSFFPFSPRNPMHAMLEVESTLTDRYQTTIPEPVRRALHLGKRDRIHYAISADGSVQLMRADDGDPVLGQFLQFLANDIAAHPAQLQAVDAGSLARIQDLVGAAEVDLDAPLAADDE